MSDVLVDQAALPADELAVDLANLVNGGEDYDSIMQAFNNRIMLRNRDLEGVIDRNSLSKVIKARLLTQGPNESTSEIWRFVIKPEDVVWGGATIWFNAGLRELAVDKSKRPASPGLVSKLRGKDQKLNGYAPNIGAWVGEGSPEGLLEAAYTEMVDLANPFAQDHDTRIYALEPINNNNESSVLTVAHRAIVASGLERVRDGYFVLGGEPTYHSVLYASAPRAA